MLPKGRCVRRSLLFIISKKELSKAKEALESSRKIIHKSMRRKPDANALRLVWSSTYILIKLADYRGLTQIFRKRSGSP